MFEQNAPKCNNELEACPEEATPSNMNKKMLTLHHTLKIIISFNMFHKIKKGLNIQYI